MYDDFRRLLGEELGIAPSPTLDSQHNSLLGGTVSPVEEAAGVTLPVPTMLVGHDGLLDELVTRVETGRVPVERSDSGRSSPAATSPMSWVCRRAAASSMASSYPAPPS